MIELKYKCDCGNEYQYGFNYLADENNDLYIECMNCQSTQYVPKEALSQLQINTDIQLKDLLSMMPCDTKITIREVGSDLRMTASELRQKSKYNNSIVGYIEQSNNRASSLVLQLD